MIPSCQQFAGDQAEIRPCFSSTPKQPPVDRQANRDVFAMTNVSLGGLEMEETEGAERDLMRFSKVERQFIAVASSMPFSPAGVDRARSSFGNPARRRELLGAARRYAKEHPVQA